MVKNVIFKLSNHDTRSSNSDFSQSLSLNNHVHNLLFKYKNEISMFYENRKWDTYKKITNDYELVFTSCGTYPSISSHNAVSRSFFKLWEILHDIEVIPKHTKLQAAFLAEGPGGFIEAFSRYNKCSNTIYGITLLSQSKNVPNWKIDANTHRKNKVHLLKGYDGSGSLYKLENIYDFVKTIGLQSCDLVTGDGGFDFSNDFNKQEEQSSKLLLCETFLALQIQKKNGSFLLKIYDIQNLETIRLLYVLNQLYEHMYFIKPMTSRPANSEKYIVCTGFKGDSEFLSSLYDEFERKIRNCKTSFLENVIDIPLWFFNEITCFNVHYISKQITSIYKTLLYIRTNQDNKVCIKEQLRKAIKWCNKYNIPISIGSLNAYKCIYK